MTNKKKILIIEDVEAMRNSLEVELEKYGFEVYGAGNLADAYRLAELHWEELDVLILDMEIEGPDKPKGADVAIKLRQQMTSFPPESLIYTWVEQVDYYRLAMKLGAAAYLFKGEHKPPVAVQHARALALRRALDGENPKVQAEVNRIAVHSGTKAEAIKTFCRRVLMPELEACLGVPSAHFVVLFTEGETTWNYADNVGLPEGSSDFYHALQFYAHGKYEMSEPVVLDTNELGTQAGQEFLPFYKRLDRAAFLPLSLSDNQRLSIGLLHRERGGDERRPTEEEVLCKALAEYLRPTVIKNVQNIWSQWTELRATRTSTARLCLAVGHEIGEGLAADDPELLEDLSNDLNDTGQYLRELESRGGPGRVVKVPVGPAVSEAWKSVAPPDGRPPIELDLKGECAVRAQREDVMIIVSRLLQWFVYRSKVMPLDVEPVVRVECETGDGVVSVTFEDNSERLPKKLREDMFAPFTQAVPTPFDKIVSTKRPAKGAGARKARGGRPNPGRYLPLYLAKMLVEGRYHGILEDHTEELKGRSYGHRILVQFPTADATS
jgi:DNA-binding NarL/FixJ family response regulator